jgi:hypothetical protein
MSRLGYFFLWGTVMRHKKRGHHRHGAVFFDWFNRHAAGVRSRPLQALLLAVAGLALAWLSLTKSLPFALASENPDWALALNDGNPDALIGKARQIMAPLLIQRGNQQGKREENRGELINTLKGLPAASILGASDEPAGERAATRNEIRQLSLRALAADPLQSEAYELLAAAAEDYWHTRAFMEEAARHSRRAANALIWLLNDSFHRGDYAAALDYGDLLLRTHPELSEPVLGLWARAAERPDGFATVAAALAKRPAWRGQYFETLPREMRQTGTPLRLMAALKADGTPPSPKELAPYLEALIRMDQVDTAYNVWLQLTAKGPLGDPGLLTDGNFENAPGSLPFDWRLTPGLNAVAGFVRPPSGGGGRFFHVNFGSGRVKFPELSQTVLLAPGRYRLEGKLQGAANGKRGLRWQLVCAKAPNRVIAQTDMLMGETEQWRIFTFEADVQASPDCVGQVLRLVHDSRSPSEEFISGEVWFGGLRLERIVNSAHATGVEPDGAEPSRGRRPLR